MRNEREREREREREKWFCIDIYIFLILGLFGFRGMRECRWKGSIIFIFIFVLREWRVRRGEDPDPSKAWVTYGCALQCVLFWQSTCRHAHTHQNGRCFVD